MPMAPILRKSPAGPAHGRRVVRHLVAMVIVVTVVTVGWGRARPAQAQTNMDDLAATVAKLNKKALDEYDNLNFEEARKILKDALDFCHEAGLDQHPVTARTNMHLGVVTLTGFKQRDVAAKYFRKALEIEPDIKLTRSLANPEIQAAFDEAAAAMAKSIAKSGAGSGGAARTGDAGISHEPVTRAPQGQALTISATIDPALNADKIVLAYRSGATGDFVTRDMVEVTPGNFTADIPASATGASAAGRMAYLIEAQKGAQPVASLGSRSKPLAVTLVAAVATGIRAPRNSKNPPPKVAGDEGAKFFLGMAVGSGVGWASGAGEINAMHVADPAGFAPAEVVHLAPEIGYFLQPDLLLSVQARIQLISGLTACTDCAPPPSTAVAAFARLTWLFGSDKLRPYFSAAAGGGRIRYVARFPKYTNCGADGASTCVESLPSGAVMLGPGAGIFYALTPGFGLVAGVNSLVGFPRFTFNADLNIGFSAQF